MQSLSNASGVDKEKSTRNALIAGILDTVITAAAFIASNSSVLLADFLKTSLECVAVLLAWFSIRRILHGKNHDYDYGISKLESLSSVFVGILMGLAVIVIGGNAIKNILSPSHIGGLGLWISTGIQIVFVGINSFMAIKAAKMSKHSPSPIITAQKQLFTTRAFGNIFIFIAIMLSMIFHNQEWSAYIDPVASLIIAGFIGFSALGVFNDSFGDLLDRTLDEEFQMVILQALAKHFDEYEDFHGIRSRRSGGHIFIEIFLEFDIERKVGEIQDFIDEMRRNIEARIPNSKVVVILSKERVV